MATHRSAAVAAVLVLGCGGAVADHETLGDRAYAERRFGDAMVEYRLALAQRAPSARLRAKAGAAALHVGDLTGAAQEYRALAGEAGEGRLAESADGLVRVAETAITAGDERALAVALAGLQEIAPGRALGGFAHQLVRKVGRVPGSTEGLSLLIYAAAGAPDARILDSLMFGYARLLGRLGRCADAVPLLESLVRREREPVIVAEAEERVALCALSLGHEALDRGTPTEAEQWFQLAATGGGNTPAARLAYLGLGDVKFALGDYAAAAEAYFRAMEGAALSDSIAAMAVEKLNALARPEPWIP